MFKPKLRIPISAQQLRGCVGDVETFLSSKEGFVFVNAETEMDLNKVIQHFGVKRLLSLIPFDLVSNFVKETSESFGGQDVFSEQPSRNTHTRHPHNEDRPLSNTLITKLVENQLSEQWLLHSGVQLVGEDMVYVWTKKGYYKSEMNVFAKVENIVRGLEFVRWCFTNNIKTSTYKDAYWGFNMETGAVSCLYHFFEGLDKGEEVYMKCFKRLVSCMKKFSCYDNYKRWAYEDDTQFMEEFLSDTSVTAQEFYDKYAKKKKSGIKKTTKRSLEIDLVEGEELEKPKRSKPDEEEVVQEQFNPDEYGYSMPPPPPPQEEIPFNYTEQSLFGNDDLQMPSLGDNLPTIDDGTDNLDFGFNE